MSFFYDLNKKLDSIRATPEVTHKQLNERDMSRAAKGYEKYGKQGMEALAKAGRDGKALDPIRKKYDKYDNEKVSEESGMTKHVIPVGVIDGPGGYDGAQQRIKDYESGNINRDGKKLPPVVDKSRPADKQLPPVVDKSRPAKSIDEGPLGFGKKVYNVGKQAVDHIGDVFSRNPKTGELNKLPDRDMKPGETFDTAWERMQDERAMRQGKGEVKRGNYTNMQVDPKTGAYVPLPPVNITDEGLAGAGKKIYDLGKRAASGINKMIGHGSDEEMLKQLGKDAGVVHPTGSKRPTPPGMQSTANPQNFADKIANAKKEVDEMLGDVAAEAMRSALSPKQKKMAALSGDPKRIDAGDLAALRKGADIDEDQPTHFVVHYKDNQKGRTAKTKVKGSSAKQAKAAWNDWNSSNTPGRFTFVAVKPVANEMDESNAFDYKSPRGAAPKVGSIERGAKHDIKHTATGRMVTRRTDDQGNSVGADDDSDAQDGPRGRGRPKGTKNVSSKAKVFQRKSKLMTKEGEDDPAEKGEYDREGDMALDDIDTIESAANELQSIIDAEDNLPEWVQSKINKAMDYLDTARDYMAAQGNDQEPIAEKAVSKQQQKFMGMARAMQKGEKIKGASKELKTVARTMKPKDTEDFAKTKHKGLPDKVKKKEVDENSEEGRLVTKRTGPGQSLTTSTTGRVSATLDKGKVSVKPGKSTDNDADTASAKDTSTSKSNSMVGKGIYDSMNRELENMIAESMSINMSDSTEGNKSLTVTATDEDAMKLAMILKSAGLGGHSGDMHSHGEEACDTCGMPDCGCGDVQEAVDENAPDYPTNTQQADNNFGYAGGLNKPKADVAGDGQSTVPVVATRPHNDDDLQRIREMAGIKIKNNLGPTSPDIALMSNDEVNAALRSGMNSKVDLGPTSPDIARMSSDEVNAALRSGMSSDISDMDPDSVNAEFGKDDRQYEDSMQRMREMAGIKESKKANKDYDGDGKLETGAEEHAGSVDKAIKKAQAEKKVDESIFALTNQWKAYKG
jgi:hypothetical protein